MADSFHRLWAEFSGHDDFWLRAAVGSTAMFVLLRTVKKLVTPKPQTLVWRGRSLLAPPKATDPWTEALDATFDGVNLGGFVLGPVRVYRPFGDQANSDVFQGPPLVCIHGFGCSALEFSRFVRGIYDPARVTSTGEKLPRAVITYERVIGVTATNQAVADGSSQKKTLSGMPFRDGEQLCSELDTLLTFLQGSANLDGPFVLMGHSYGGLIAQMFAILHPAKVCGLVLLDSAHEDQYKLWPKDFVLGFQYAIPPLFTLYRWLAPTKFLSVLNMFGAFNFPPVSLYDTQERKLTVQEFSKSLSWAVALDELVGCNATFDEMTQFRVDHSETKLTSATPISIVLAGDRHISPTFQPKAVTKAFIKMHEKLVEETAAEVFMANHSDHWVHLEQAEVCLEATASVYARLKTV